MKKLLFTFLISLIFMSGISAQGDFKIGVTGGLFNTNVNIKLSALGINLGNLSAINKTGLYLGVAGDYQLSDKFYVQPELTYANAGGISFIHLPILAKYYVIDKLHVQAGPQFSFSTNVNDVKNALRDINDVVNSGDDLDSVINTLGIDFGFGAGYDISEKLTVQARFSKEITNRYSGPINNSLKVKPSNFNLGVIYFF